MWRGPERVSAVSADSEGAGGLTTRPALAEAQSRKEAGLTPSHLVWNFCLAQPVKW